jgi:hypothetical protein
MESKFESSVIPKNLGDLLQGKVLNMTSAVRDRTTTKFRVQGSSNYSNNNRTIQFRLTSSNYADLSTACLHWKLKRDSTLQATEDLAMLSAIESARLLIAGKEVERVNNVRALKPIIYTKCSSDYYNTTLSFAGAWKYRPCRTGVLATNASATSAPNADARATVADNNYTLTLPAGSEGANGANIVLDPLRILLMPHTATSTSNFGTGSGTANLGYGTHSGSFGHPTNSQATSYSGYRIAYNNPVPSNLLGGLVLENSFNPYTGSLTDGFSSQHIGRSGDLSESQSMPLSLIFGLCAKENSLFPLRNVGSIEIELNLAPYESWFLHKPVTSTIGAGNASVSRIVDITNTKNNAVHVAGYDKYSIINPVITCDIVQVADSIVSRIDQMCSSDTGFNMSFQSYSTISQPMDYQESVTLNYLQGYSSLRDVYVSFQPAVGMNPYYPKSDYTLGSRFLQSNLQVGSTNFPAQDIEGASEAYTELMKTYDDSYGKPGGIIGYAEYLGQRTASLNAGVAQTAGAMPSIAAAQWSDRNVGACQVASIPIMKPSCFILGNSLQKVLHHGKTYSGLSTRSSGLGLTHNLKFKSPTLFVDPANNKESLANPNFIDAHLGQVQMIANTVFSHDVLLTIANDAVTVAV